MSYPNVFSAARSEALMPMPAGGRVIMSLDINATTQTGYINGVQAGSKTAAYAKGGLGYNTIGINVNGPNMGLNFKGKIWGVAIHADPTKRAELEAYLSSLYPLVEPTAEPALVVSTTAGSTGASVSSSPINISGCNLIIVNFTFPAGASATVGDNMGNTYLPLTRRESGGIGHQVFYCLNCTPSAALVVSASWAGGGSPLPATINVAAFKNMSLTGLIGQNGGGASPEMGVSTGTVSPAGKALVISAMDHHENLGYHRRVDNGFQLIQQSPYNPYTGTGLAYKFVDTTGSVGSKWTVYDQPIIGGVNGTIAAFRFSGPLPAPLPAAPALLASTGASSFDGGGVTTNPIDTTGAKFLIASICYGGSVIGTMFDTFGNRWVKQGTDVVSPGGSWVSTFACFNPKVGPDHSFWAIAGVPSISVAAFSWMGALTASITTAISSATSMTYTKLAPNGWRRAVFFATAGGGVPDFISIDSGFKMITENQYAGGWAYSSSLAYKVQESMEPTGPTWQFGNSVASGQLLMFTAVAEVDQIPLEATAWEHWFFNGLSIGSGVTSIINGMKGSGTLTPSASAPYDTTGRSIILVPNGGTNGLSANFADRASYTVCMVIKRPTNIEQTPCTYYAGTSKATVTTGHILYSGAGDANVVAVAAPGIGAVARQWSLDNIATGDWCFIAMKVESRVPGVSVNGSVFSMIGAAATAMGNNLAFGNKYDTAAASSNELEIAEIIVFDAVLTDSDLKGVYQRSILRMESLGIPITSGMPNAPSALSKPAPEPPPPP
jgi:hypothetical protein